jgi:hypothetical protein
MGSAAADHDLLDRRPADETGFTGAPVGPQLHFEEAFRPSGVDIIGDRRSAGGDGLLEYAHESSTESLEFRPRQRPSTPPGTDAGAKKGLVRVNVSYSMKQLLIEQGSFDWGLTPAEKLNERSEIDRQWLCTGPDEFIMQ